MNSVSLLDHLSTIFNLLAFVVIVMCRFMLEGMTPLSEQTNGETAFSSILVTTVISACAMANVLSAEA